MQRQNAYGCIWQKRTWPCSIYMVPLKGSTESERVTRRSRSKNGRKFFLYDENTTRRNPSEASLQNIIENWQIQTNFTDRLAILRRFQNTSEFYSVWGHVNNRLSFFFGTEGTIPIRHIFSFEMKRKGVYSR